MQTDYAARAAFLEATTGVMRPAPIDTLLELLSLVRAWRDGVLAQTGNTADGESIAIIIATSHWTISPLDDSAEAAALKTAVCEWVKKQPFQTNSAWLGDFAMNTLMFHALAPATARKWYFLEPYEDIHPTLGDVMPRRGGESNKEYLARYDRAYQEQRKAYVKLTQAAVGARKGISRHSKGRLGQHQPARWTALAFTGLGWAEIAKTENAQCLDSAIRKAVIEFCKRANLIPPVGDFVGSRGKKTA